MRDVQRTRRSGTSVRGDAARDTQITTWVWLYVDGHGSAAHCRHPPDACAALLAPVEVAVVKRHAESMPVRVLDGILAPVSPRIIDLSPTDLLGLLAVDPRGYVRLVDAYEGDIVRASHQLATARLIASGDGTVPTPAELHSAATSIVVHLERLGALIDESAPSPAVLAGDCKHLGLPVIGTTEPEDD